MARVPRPGPAPVGNSADPRPGAAASLPLGRPRTHLTRVQPGEKASSDSPGDSRETALGEVAPRDLEISVRADENFPERLIVSIAYRLTALNHTELVEFEVAGGV